MANGHVNRAKRPNTPSQRARHPLNTSSPAPAPGKPGSDRRSGAGPAHRDDRHRAKPEPQASSPASRQRRGRQETPTRAAPAHRRLAPQLADPMTREPTSRLSGKETQLRNAHDGSRPTTRRARPTSFARAYALLPVGAEVTEHGAIDALRLAAARVRAARDLILPIRPPQLYRCGA